VREKLSEREQLLSRGASGTKATVLASHQIRTQLKQARDDANRLMAMQRKEAAKTRGKEKAVEQAENRQEVVELIFKHIDECELQEKKRYTSKNSEARTELFAGSGRGVALGPAGSSNYPSCSGAGPSSSMGGSALPEIDSETQEGLQLLERKNVAIDEQLEVVAEGVNELKSIALNMRDEVKVQSAMVDEITSKVDSASSHLNNMNRKMKQTLAKTRSADRFILDFILLVVLLAIVGYIISMVTGNGR
jgi:SYP7 family syntaxin